MIKNSYLLYGTLGCHLCEQAEQLLTQAQQVMAIEWQTVDIALDQNLVTQYGLQIPVLLTKTGQQLNWPFSLLDIQRLQEP
jgi:predicted DCC family thiol-disulfide oxidoreductase YuxK